MYRCNECWKEFETQEKYVCDRGEFWGAPYTEYYNGCPHCKSADFSEIKGYCDFCNCKLYERDPCYELPDGTKFCENCVEHKEA